MTPATAPVVDELSLPEKGEQKPEATDSQATDQAADHSVSIDNVVEDSEYYTAEQIERLLGVSPRLFFAAFHEHGGTIFTQHRGDGERLELRGSQIKRWIRGSGIEAVVSDDAARVYKITHRGPEPAAPEPKRAPTIVERANALAKEEAGCEAAGQKESLATYYAILRAEVVGKSDAIADSSLAMLMADLELTSEMVTADLELIRSAIRQQKLHSEKDASLNRRTKAHQKYKQLEKKHKEENEAARKAFSKANGDYISRGNALSEIVKLARQRPAFFTATDLDDHGNPPQLREPAASHV